VIEEYLREDFVTLAIQINGKTRGTIDVLAGVDEAEALAAALDNKNVKKYVGDKVIARKIYVPGKILNIIISK
jgi:leucyl-tRNA synthetase